MRSLSAATILATVFISGIAVANDLSSGPDGSVEIMSREVDGLPQLVQGTGSQIELEVEIKLPSSASAANPVPAVIILHGGSGVDDAREEALAEFLEDNGIAGVIVDSFGSRSISGRNFLVMWSRAFVADQAADAMATLAALRTHPMIDPNRIAVAGMSMGAWTVMVLHSTGAEGFSGMAGLYGPCTWAAPSAAIATPILLLQGGSDSSIDIDQCQAYSDAINAGGGSAELVIYPNAAHTFIHEGLPSGSVSGFDLAGGHCEWSIAPDGSVSGLRSGNTATTDAGFIDDIFLSCAEKGGLTYNFDRGARDDAFQRIVSLARR